MIDFNDYTNGNKISKLTLSKVAIYSWSSIHPSILIIGGSGSGKTNALLNLVNNQPDIVKIYLYAKGPYEPK